MHPLIHNSKSTILVYMVLNGIEHLTGCGSYWLSLVSFLVKVPVALELFMGNWQYCKDIEGFQPWLESEVPFHLKEHHWTSLYR